MKWCLFREFIRFGRDYALSVILQMIVVHPDGLKQSSDPELLLIQAGHWFSPSVQCCLISHRLSVRFWICSSGISIRMVLFAVWFVLCIQMADVRSRTRDLDFWFAPCCILLSLR